MLAGHFTTAFLAKQRAPSGHIAFYLIASQLPDLLWLLFHYLGLEATEPGNVMEASLHGLEVDMTYSHDLLPLPFWILLTTVAGRWLFKSWRPGVAGAVLVFVHAVTDYVGGFEHFVFGPDSQVVGTGLYYTAPYLAVGLEALFIIATLIWIVRKDQALGVQRDRKTWLMWAGVYGYGLAFMFITAEHTMSGLLGIDPVPWLDGTTVPLLGITYIGMIWALAAASSPKRNRSEAS